MFLGTLFSFHTRGKVASSSPLVLRTASGLVSQCQEQQLQRSAPLTWVSCQGRGLLFAERILWRLNRLCRFASLKCHSKAFVLSACLLYLRWNETLKIQSVKTFPIHVVLVPMVHIKKNQTNQPKKPQPIPRINASFFQFLLPLFPKASQVWQTEAVYQKFWITYSVCFFSVLLYFQNSSRRFSLQIYSFKYLNGSHILKGVLILSVLAASLALSHCLSKPSQTPVPNLTWMTNVEG